MIKVLSRFTLIVVQELSYSNATNKQRKTEQKLEIGKVISHPEHDQGEHGKFKKAELEHNASSAVKQDQMLYTLQANDAGTYLIQSL